MNIFVEVKRLKELSEKEGNSDQRIYTIYSKYIHYILIVLPHISTIHVLQNKTQKQETYLISVLLL